MTTSTLNTALFIPLLEEVSQWGNTTTIILHGGSVFEFKGRFPIGSVAEGYYNLKGENGFEGHLNISSIAEIQLISKQHRGRESHAFVFVNQKNEPVFKIFLGRDKKGILHAEQVAAFNRIKSTQSI